MQVLGHDRTVGMVASVLLIGAFVWSVYRRRQLANPTSTPDRFVASGIYITLFALILISHAEIFLVQNHSQVGERSWASIGQVRFHTLSETSMHQLTR
jgi:hypothetical protein